MTSGHRLLLFLLVSVMAHGAVLGFFATSGQQAAGGSGHDTISIKAAPESIGALVKEWQKPVEAQSSVADLTPPNVDAAKLPQRIPDTPRFTPQTPLPMAAPIPDPSPKADTPPPRPAKKTTGKPAKPKSNAASKPQPRAQAKGPGNTKTKGNGGKAQASTGTSARAATLKKQWGAAILNRIERQKRRAGAKGRVRLRISVGVNGALSSVQVITTSGNPSLDRAAVATVRRARLPRAPRGMPAGVHRFSMTLIYTR